MEAEVVEEEGEESLQSQQGQHRRHHWTTGLTFFKMVRSCFASSTMHLSSGASDGFCVSTESFTQRQSKIEFEEVMFSKGDMFSIQENDFQVRVCQKHTPLINCCTRCQNLAFTTSKSRSRPISVVLSAYVVPRKLASGLPLFFYGRDQICFS